MQNVRGTRDILPSEVGIWRRIEIVLNEWMRRYGYDEIRTPIIEYADVFYRGLGQDTDAVGKEMYVFSDRSDNLLALRPELTAPVARAIVQHALTSQSSLLRLWYYGPCFRYERPQKGRQRQFHQAGAECIGSPEPDADVEILALAWDIITTLVGSKTVSLYINTLGSAAEQHTYREILVEHLKHYQSDLSPISQQRLTTNPLRILDSKESSDRSIIAAAPPLMGVLGQSSREHYETVLTLLTQLEIPYIEDPHLVRGLDYYTHTVFEIRSAQLGAQDAVGGGGRYDNLIAMMGGEVIPGVGFGIGIERLILSMKQMENKGNDWQMQVYIAADRSCRTMMHQVAHWLRTSDVPVVVDVQYRSLKAQLRQANKLRCALAILIEHSTDFQNSVVVKDMRTGEQRTVPFDCTIVTHTVKQLLAI